MPGCASPCHDAKTRRATIAINFLQMASPTATAEDISTFQALCQREAAMETPMAGVSYQMQATIQSHLWCDENRLAQPALQLQRFLKLCLVLPLQRYKLLIQSS